MNWKLPKATAAFALLATLWMGSAQASVVITGTRVIFPGDSREVTVRLMNDGDAPALVQAWIDTGNEKEAPEKISVPFVLTPAMFRLEAGKGQSLRLIQTQESLPAGRESLFWLNVLEIPPKPNATESEGKNLLQFAIRSRLKLFYRPAKLSGDPTKAPGLVTWKIVADGQGYALEAHNSTPYHITFIRLSVDVGGKPYTADTGMVDPFGTLRLALKGLTQAPATGTPVAYDIVNDYGASASFKGTVTP